MKKTTLLFPSILLFVTQLTWAQFTVSKIDNSPFTNGEIVSFTTHSLSSSELKFIVSNTSSQNLDFRIRCMDIVNGSGANFQLCWGYECIPSVSVNSIYPNYQNIINAGGNTVGLGDSFKNFNPGDGINYPVDYSFRFFARDLNGNNVGSNFNITYRYQGPLSIDQKDKLQAMGVKLGNTHVQQFIALEINNEVSYALSNLQGQRVMEGNLDASINLDLSSLQTGVYLLNFSNNDGLTDTVKIYKK